MASSEYRVLILPSAIEELESIPLKKDRQRITARIRKLSRDPRPPGCQTLVGQPGRYRVRQGRYRIVYSVDDRERTVLIVKIGHRRDVYR